MHPLFEIDLNPLVTSDICIKTSADVEDHATGYAGLQLQNRDLDFQGSPVVSQITNSAETSEIMAGVWEARIR